MRVRMLVAMIATPLLASVASAQSSNANDHANMRFKVCEKLSPAKNKQGPSKAGNSSNVRREPRKCVPDVPPPVTPPVTDPASGIAEIHGMAFNDANGNGVFDSGEAPLAGWVVQLSGTVNSVTTTGADGSYQFTSLPVGTYTICAATGMTQSAPSSGPACPGGASGWSADVPDFLPSVWYLDIDFALH